MATTAASTSRILHFQQSIFRDHLPPSLLQRMETPVRHRGMNAVKIQGDRSKPPLVLAHGFGSGLGFFFACLPDLAASGRTIYLVDWLGFGGSERPSIGGCAKTRVDADFFTQPLHAWMEAEGIEKCTLVGHSLGGLLACKFAQKYPNKLDRVVLASPAGMSHTITQPPPQTARAYLGNKLLDLIWNYNLMTPQKIVRSLGLQRGKALVHNAVQRRFSNAKSWNAPLVADYLFEITSAKPSGGELALSALLSAPFQTRSMVARELVPDALPVPVHTMFGDHDWLNTKSGLEHAKRLGNVSVISNAGHHLYMDQPQEFARLCLLE